MGIPGLLQALRGASTEVHAAQLAGLTVGVDTYCWLHRGGYGCARRLCLGEPTDMYVRFVEFRVEMLRHHGVTPVLVFDGASLPSKGATDAGRRTRRAAMRAKGEALLADGNHAKADSCFQKAFEVTAEMAAAVISAMQAQGVECIVAPYEADAQLAWLARNGVVDAVITEDSDLLVYGVERVIFKMDRLGAGVEINAANLSASSSLDLHGWSHHQFMHMCILAGCDYLPSPTNVGLKTANRLVSQSKSLPDLFARLVTSRTLPLSYITDFLRAKLTFRHQTVYDTHARCAVPLEPFDVAELSDLPSSAPPIPLPISTFVGPMPTQHVARAIAAGLLHPDTHAPLVPAPTSPAGSAALLRPGKRKRPSSASAGPAPNPAPWSLAPRPASTPLVIRVPSYSRSGSLASPSASSSPLGARPANVFSRSSSSASLVRVPSGVASAPLPSPANTEGTRGGIASPLAHTALPFRPLIATSQRPLKRPRPLARPAASPAAHANRTSSDEDDDGSDNDSDDESGDDDDDVHDDDHSGAGSRASPTDTNAENARPQATVLPFARTLAAGSIFGPRRKAFRYPSSRA
ncbi:exodeoxyribonuclease 1 [Thecamonas trahens ATCC 50062]|uniref:Exodeoxyribonuclease 1 n=1 Tax=Thecamonas trahens ATCC 50062 TaxID=461836 RepID=A0A0L0D5E5_THETB|nr:exodeoxyribonuclease 1 [Thecamonas trahens ATCC 50062]KNC47306.1 exodeoxyribonuclease 1 [Thecamonas trahens ATCC 50062]|eukprot:XP_013759647.1 exodeoxyribonuclease 1 [Thecamonas trahens ATCC 50062]